MVRDSEERRISGSKVKSVEGKPRISSCAPAVLEEVGRGIARFPSEADVRDLGLRGSGSD